MKYTITSIRDTQMESLLKSTVSDNIVTLLKLFRSMPPSTQYAVLETLREDHFQQVLNSVGNKE